MSPQALRAAPTERKLFAEALDLHAKGNLLAAEERYQAMLRLNPRSGEANNGLGVLSLAADKPNFAVGFFEKAVASERNNFRFLNNLGNILMDIGRTEEGLPYLERALKLKPDSFELRLNIGRAYKDMGMAAKGAEHLTKAAAARPEMHECQVTLADCLTTLGRNSEAEEHFRIAQKLGARPGSYLYGIASARKQTVENNILSEIEAALDSAPSADGGNTKLHFAAAKTCMDLTLTEKAWTHLAAANEPTRDFNLKKFVDTNAAFKKVFNRNFIEARRSDGSPSERPIFIVGMPRSGTSLTEQILSSHPDVYGAGELTYIHTIANRLFFSLDSVGLFPEQVRALTPAKTLALANEYLSKIEYFSKTSLRITDKMPHNFVMVGLIGLLFPKARIIYCRREPLDNCFSIYSNAMNNFHNYGSDLATLGTYFREHRSLMDHWIAALPGRIFDLEYEKLVDDLEGVARKMIDFIGLPWNPACLQFFETERTVATLSKWQVRQPLYKTSVARWKPFKTHLGPLIEALGDLASLEK